MTDQETLLDYVIETGTGFWTDDFGYQENWQNLVPKDWTLERFYNATGELDQIFSDLSIFSRQINHGDYIDGSELFIKKNNVVLNFSFLYGQGSDLGVFIAKEQEYEHTIVIDWEDIETIRHKSFSEKALWYVQTKLELIDLTVDQYIKIGYLIGLGIFHNITKEQITGTKHE